MPPLTILHVAAGTLALAGGYAAFALRKGGRGHALAGQVFTGSMLVMALSALTIALRQGERLNALSACLTLYLVATGWHAARQRNPAQGRTIGLGAGLALAIAAGGYLLGWQTMQPGFADGDGGGTGNLPAPYFVFASIALLAALHDLRVLRRGACSPGERIARHLWRMSLALAISAAAVFLGQQDEMPAWMLGPHLLVPPLAALGLMAWWLVKVRRSGLVSARPAPRP